MTLNLTPLKRLRRGLMGSCLIALAATSAACHRQGPAGQVIATVNGQEITPQDLQAEARSNPALAQADASVLLPRVIARALLAQAGHNRGMDSYPGYPSDLARLKQDFIAQRMVRASLKAPAKPTPAELAKVMADNPYSFARRQSITVDDISMQPPPGAVGSLESLKYPDDIMERLNRLSIPNNRRTLTLDTAKIPAALAARLSTQDVGALFFVRDNNELAAMTVTGRTPVAARPDEEEAAATQMFQAAKVQDEIEALVAQLKSQAKIVYRNGFVPAHKADASSPPQR